MTSLYPPSPLGESSPVPLGEIESELSRRLAATRSSADPPVQRARMSNLVIYCDRPEAAAEAEPRIPEIVALHPARVLLLKVDPDHTRNLPEATVHLRVLRAEHGPRVSSEQITLTAGGRSVDHLPYAVRGLLIGDLPTNLWWAAHQPPPLAGALLFDLAEHAQQIIYDSFAWPDPARGVAAAASWLPSFERGDGLGERRVASDLNWRRLKTWRRLLAQALDPGSAPGALDSIAEVLIEHGPYAGVQAWQIAGWLASRLEWLPKAGRVVPGTEYSWQLAAPHGLLRVRIVRLADAAPEVLHVRLTCALNGRLGAINITTCEEGQRLCSQPEGLDVAARTMTLPPQPLADLVARQLSDRERDPVFRESMAAAQKLAQALPG